MKRLFSYILALTLVLTMLPSAVYASLNESDMSFAEIQEALDTYNLKLWLAGNWSSVVVPTGIYTVGKDIPAGIYEVHSAYKSNKCDIYRWSPDDEVYNYFSDNPLYLETSVGNGVYELVLQEGDHLQLDKVGLTFSISTYVPRFSVDQEKEEAVNTLYEEYQSLDKELRKRPEWKEVSVPEGIYEVGPQIPAEHWTIWPPHEYSIIGVYYGPTLLGKDLVTYETGILKDSSLSSFKYGFQNDRYSIDAKEGWYIKVSDPVVFTPYAGNSLFLFNP